MASSNFIEDVLKKDIDENAVSALVGSLETQLASNIGQNASHPVSVANVSLNHVNSAIQGQSSVISQNGVITSTSVGTTSLSENTKMLTSNIVVPSAGSHLRINTQAGIPASGYISQMQNSSLHQNSGNLSSSSNFSNTNMHPTNSNNLSNQSSVTAIPNGTLNTGSHQLTTKTQAPTMSSSAVQNLLLSKVNQNLVTINSNPSLNQVIHSAGSGSVSTNTNSNQVTAVSHANSGAVQIVNVNNIRSNAPVAASQKTVAPTVLIGTPNVVGSRPGTPGPINIQTFPGFQAGAQGHLLVKTENGQYQLLRVGPPGSLTPNTGAYRLQSVPQSTQASHGNSVVVTPAQTQSNLSSQSNQSAASQQMTPETAKIKCKNFLATLLRLANDQPEAVARNVRNLIQGLIDGKVEAEEFTTNLQRELNSSPQPCLVPFLKKSLPYLRNALALKELSIDGVRAPSNASMTVPLTSSNNGPQIQVRAPISTAPIRVVAPTSSGVPAATSLAQQRAAIPRIATPKQIINKSNIINTRVNAGTAGSTGLSVALNSVPSFKQAGFNKFPQSREKEKRVASTAFRDSGDDDINDVAAMGGVNLQEESQKILGSTEFVGTQIRSCKDENFLLTAPLTSRMKSIASKFGLDEVPSEVTSLVSHATEGMLKTLVYKLGLIAEHRLEIVKGDTRYETLHDVKGQLKFLEELDRLERKRHEEQEREILLRAAKSRSKAEDPEQAKLKAKAKELQRAEMEEMRQREANLTALQAIGPRKKPKIELGSSLATNSQGSASGSSSNSFQRPQLPLRPRVKRVNLKDLLFLMEQERQFCRTNSLYRFFFK